MAPTMDSYSIMSSNPCWCIFMHGFIENAGGFILKDLRKFMGLNKSLARLKARSKVPGKT